MRDKLTVKASWSRSSLWLAVALGALGPTATSCSSSNSNVSALPSDVKAIVFLQRSPRNDKIPP